LKSNFTEVVIITQITHTSVLTHLIPSHADCMQHVHAGKGNLMAQNTRKTFGGRGAGQLTELPRPPSW